MDQSGISRQFTSRVRAPPQTQAAGWAAPDHGAGQEQRSDELPEEAWREITVAEGSQGPRTYRFSAQRVRVTRWRKPGGGASPAKSTGRSTAATWTAANLATTCPTHPRTQLWRLWHTWAIIFHLEQWDSNCPQHIRPRYSPDQIAPVVEELNSKIDTLEVLISDLQAKLAHARANADRIGEADPAKSPGGDQ